VGSAPVNAIPGEDPDREPEPGIGLCLSGGGYRAMLFHLGALWRLYETGRLRDIARISSVSGGSITAGLLALKWRSLSFDPARVEDDFLREVVAPLRGLADRTIDVGSVLFGLVLPGGSAAQVAAAYRKHLFGPATLQDLPDSPRFVLNATNMQSGVLWRFMKPYMRDYRVGEVKKPTVLLAQAVAASSAFPPVLSPLRMALDPKTFSPPKDEDLHHEPFTSKVFLSDGGVYDNLGLETVWKRYKTVLVSDAGGKLQPEPKPKTNWLQHSYRVLNVIDNQVRALRKRQLIDSYIAKQRDGTYWGIRTNVADYKVPTPLPCPFDRTMRLAETPTRLARMDPLLQERLINWGYAVCDAALRRHVDPAIPAPTKFPYPKAEV